MGIIYQSVPIGAIQTLEEARRDFYITKSLETPQRIQDILFSSDTGAFIRGLAKSYDIPINLSPRIALAILFTAIGEKKLIELPALLSTELGIPPDKAQKIASEIEHDIFGPAKAELDEFLSRKAGSQPQDAATSTLRIASLDQSKHQNVLDLKEIAVAKRQELLTAKPERPALPPAPSAFNKASADKHLNPPTPPKFPLPPRAPMPLPTGRQAPKPPTSPIPFTDY